MTRTHSSRRQRVVLLVATCVLANPAFSAAVSLQSVLEQLVADGYPILYSSDLVDAELRVNIEEVSLPALRAALPSVGLVLQREAEFYVVGRLSPEMRPERVGAAAEGTDPERRLETMIVTGTRHRLSGTRTGTVSTLTAEELRLTPSLGGDAMRVTTRLPGMSSVGVSAKPQIRGGLQDEVLVRVDGVELFDAYHLADFQSFFSIVDDRTVDAVDVYTGGFPARYGNRMSGVMDISTRERQDQDRTELGLSAISVFANTSGRLRSDRTRYVASLRHGNLKYLTDEIDHPIGAPRYYDAYGQISHRPSDSTTLTLGTLLTSDDVSLVDDVETAESNIDNRYLWARVERTLNSSLASDSLLTVSWSDRHLSQQSPAEDEDETDAFLDHQQAVRKVNLRSDLRYQNHDFLMEFGADAEWAESRYDSRAMADRGDLGLVLDGERFRRHDIDINPVGWSGGVYWSGEFALGAGLEVLPGLRWDLQDYEGSDATDHLSPRIGIRYRPAPTLTLRLDSGRYHQPEAVYELPVADGVTAFAPPQRSDHFVVGMEWLAGDDWELGIDVYRKNYSRTKRRFENLFNPFVMIPELEADRVGLTPRKARVRGVDLQVRGHLTPALSTVLRYSYMDAEDRFESNWVPRRWSQRNTVNWILAWKRETFDLAAAVTWHSGWRGSTPPAEVPEGETLRVEDVLNNTELSDYVSVDISASRTWQFNRAALTLYADVTNVLNRRNVAGIDWDASEEDGTFVFERSTDVLLPLIPSVGILIVF